ncbi:hypothetical protein BGW80DRAFT_1299726, partial [Lactifluus volemus]
MKHRTAISETGRVSTVWFRGSSAPVRSCAQLDAVPRPLYRVHQYELPFGDGLRLGADWAAMCSDSSLGPRWL